MKQTSWRSYFALQPGPVGVLVFATVVEARRRRRRLTVGIACNFGTAPDGTPLMSEVGRAVMDRMAALRRPEAPVWIVDAGRPNRIRRRVAAVLAAAPDGTAVLFLTRKDGDGGEVVHALNLTRAEPEAAA